MAVLRAARLGDAWGAVRMTMGNGELRAIHHAVTGGAIRASARAPAQAARSAHVHGIREDHQDGHGRGATRIRAMKAQTNPKASVDSD
eukprot:7715060-Pyramimonas_sp.AAC.1